MNLGGPAAPGIPRGGAPALCRYFSSVRLNFHNLLTSAGSPLTAVPSPGMLFDYMLVYDYSFYLSGVLLMAAGVVMVIPWRYTNAWQRGSSLYRPAERAAQKAAQAAQQDSAGREDRPEEAQLV